MSPFKKFRAEKCVCCDQVVDHGLYVRLYFAWQDRTDFLCMWCWQVMTKAAAASLKAHLQRT